MVKVLIGMSGGVDSSVAVYLLKQRGFDTTGITLVLYGHEGVSDAEKVAEDLDIYHMKLNVKNAFKKQVIDRFISAYDQGVTPNPCIECNKRVKFESLFEMADSLGIPHVATGHYARIGFENNRWVLKKGADPKKDQSYVLYTLSQPQLARLIFPLGDMTKDEIREIAAREGFVNANKGDSQDICFIPDGDYAQFILQNTSKTYPDGDFVDENGNVLGRHRGIIRYTTGQRKGLGLALPQPMYVCNKDLEKNQVVLGLSDSLFTDELFAKNLNWMYFATPPKSFSCSAKVRYSQNETPCTVTVLDDGRVKVHFLEKVRAITKGQAVVFYKGDTVIGGGEIE